MHESTGGIAACQATEPRRSADGARSVEVGKADTVASESIQMRRPNGLRTVAGDVPVAEIVGEHQYDVGSRRRSAAAQRCQVVAVLVDPDVGISPGDPPSPDEGNQRPGPLAGRPGSGSIEEALACSGLGPGNVWTGMVVHRSGWCPAEPGPETTTLADSMTPVRASGPALASRRETNSGRGCAGVSCLRRARRQFLLRSGDSIQRARHESHKDTTQDPHGPVEEEMQVGVLLDPKQDEHARHGARHRAGAVGASEKDT